MMYKDEKERKKNGAHQRPVSRYLAPNFFLNLDLSPGAPYFFLLKFHRRRILLRAPIDQSRVPPSIAISTGSNRVFFFVTGFPFDERRARSIEMSRVFEIAIIKKIRFISKRLARPMFYFTTEI